MSKTDDISDHIRAFANSISELNAGHIGDVLVAALYDYAGNFETYTVAAHQKSSEAPEGYSWVRSLSFTIALAVTAKLYDEKKQPISLN